MKIFCLPYAGGSSSVFAKWKTYMSRDIEIVAPELAGRGTRFNDEKYVSIQSAADDIYSIFLKKINQNEKFAIFGHSMGCFIVYELYRRIYAEPRLRKNLVHIFMSGNYAPHLNNVHQHHTEFYKMGNEGMKHELKRLGGVSDEVLDDPLFTKYFMPIIRSDYYITETYIPEKIVKFCCGCTVFNGVEDDLTEEDLTSWKKYSPCGFSIKNFPGNHFFINEHCDLVIGQIRKILGKYIENIRKNDVKL